jgi:hypothetical protein
MSKKVKTSNKKAAFNASMPNVPFENDLSHPDHPLNRTKDVTKEQIEAKRDQLIERDKARSHAQHRILTGAPDNRDANLTDADKKAIAELESGQAQRKEVATANRIAKLKAKKAGATTTMPLTGKAALSAIAQSVTETFVANGGKIKKSDDQQEPKVKTKTAKTAKTAKAKSSTGPTADLLKVLQGKGCTAAQALKVTGWKQISIPPIIRRAGFKVKKTKTSNGTLYQAV